MLTQKIFFLSFFILRERERERERENINREGAETEGERESQGGSVPSMQSQTWGSNLQTTRS